MAPSQFRLIRITGLGVCITLLALRSVEFLQQGRSISGLLTGGWLLELVTFCVALSFNTSSRKWSQLTSMFWMACQSITVIGMGIVHMNAYLGFLLLVIAWQLALLMPKREALYWIGGQTVLLAGGHVIVGYTFWAWMVALVCIVFKCFTYLVVFSLKREGDLRAEQSVFTAQVLAARELFAERSRSRERLRISRDLHDVLGHRLTALSLNLEIALNKGESSNPRFEIERAQRLTKDLLRDVREVVSAMRLPETVDLRENLECMTEAFSPLSIHMQIPDELRTCDSDRAEVLIRCTQELVTNSVKHGNASQLWIDLSIDDNQVVHVQSRDDGARRSDHLDLGNGLSAMGERFKEFGGNVSVTCDATTGFALRASLPMRPVGLVSVAA